MELLTRQQRAQLLQNGMHARQGELDPHQTSTFHSRRRRDLAAHAD
jgi:hypothetical protein